MTNFEKYRKDIEETGYRFGYDIKTNEITRYDIVSGNIGKVNIPIVTLNSMIIEMLFLIKKTTNPGTKKAKLEVNELKYIMMKFIKNMWLFFIGSGDKTSQSFSANIIL